MKFRKSKEQAEGIVVGSGKSKPKIPFLHKIEKSPGPQQGTGTSKFNKRKLLLVTLLGIVIIGLLIMLLKFVAKDQPTPAKSESVKELEAVNLEGVAPILAVQHYLVLGGEYEKNGLTNEAESTYLKALSLVSGDESKDVLRKLYVFYRTHEEQGKAKNIANQLLDILIKQNNPFSYKEISEIEGYIGNTEKAQEYQQKYEDAIKSLSKRKSQEGPN